jgi:hypothetical protein
MSKQVTYMSYLQLKRSLILLKLHYIHNVSELNLEAVEWACFDKLISIYFTASNITIYDVPRYVGAKKSIFSTGLKTFQK